MTPPDDDKVGDAVRQNDHSDGGQRAGFLQQHVIGGQHDLLGLEPKLVGDVFQRVDGRAVDVGLASFAQAAVMDVDAESVQQRS